MRGWHLLALVAVGVLIWTFANPDAFVKPVTNARWGCLALIVISVVAGPINDWAYRKSGRP